jgi:hypothetical protein
MLVPGSSAASWRATRFTIEDPFECGPMLDEAPATPEPVVVEASAWIEGKRKSKRIELGKGRARKQNGRRIV